MNTKVKTCQIRWYNGSCTESSVGTAGPASDPYQVCADHARGAYGFRWHGISKMVELGLNDWYFLNDWYEIPKYCSLIGYRRPAAEKLPYKPMGGGRPDAETHQLKRTKHYPKEFYTNGIPKIGDWLVEPDNQTSWTVMYIGGAESDHCRLAGCLDAEGKDKSFWIWDSDND